MKPDRLSPELRARLRHVRVTKADVDLSRFPDFLIIGPQRTGTTWLHANLREHPEVFLSEPKELFFFSRLKEPDHPKHQSNELEWYLKFFDDPLWLWAYKQAMCLRRHRRPYGPKVRGEATASYAAIDRDVIAEITALNPQVKAIMMVRDPIDRAWSHAKKDLVRNRGRRLEEVDEQEFRQFFADPYQLRCARYGENLENWSAELPDGHVFVGRFDDIERRPESFLTDVLAFLGVSTDRRYVPVSVREAVNPTAESQVPEQYRRFLEELLAEELRAWRERFA